MSRPTTLKQTVYLRDPESGEPVILKAGSKPEARLAKLIENPHAWGAEDVEDDAADGPDAGEQPGADDDEKAKAADAKAKASAAKQ